MKIKMKELRFLPLCIFILGLSACIAPGTSFFDLELPHPPDTSEIASNRCVIVTRINLSETTSSFRSRLVLTIGSRPTTGLAVAAFTLQPGTNFRVAVLKPGTYLWRELIMGGLSGLFRDDYVFECVEKQVTYIGDVDLRIDWSSRKYGIRFADRRDLADEAFTSAYPIMASKNPMSSKITTDSRLPK